MKHSAPSLTCPYRRTRAVLRWCGAVHQAAGPLSPTADRSTVYRWRALSRFLLRVGLPALASPRLPRYPIVSREMNHHALSARK
jgi:hypothetical protein